MKPVGAGVQGEGPPSGSCDSKVPPPSLTQGSREAPGKSHFCLFFLHPLMPRPCLPLAKPPESQCEGPWLESIRVGSRDKGSFKDAAAWRGLYLVQSLQTGALGDLGDENAPPASPRPSFRGSLLRGRGARTLPHPRRARVHGFPSQLLLLPCSPSAQWPYSLSGEGH